MLDGKLGQPLRTLKAVRRCRQTPVCRTPARPGPDPSRKPPFPCGNPCRLAPVYGNTKSGVCRTCWLGPEQPSACDRLPGIAPSSRCGATRSARAARQLWTASLGSSWLPGTGRDDVEQVQLLVPLLRRKTRAPFPSRSAACSSPRPGKSVLRFTRGHSSPFALCAVTSTRSAMPGCATARRRRSATRAGKARPYCATTCTRKRSSGSRASCASSTSSSQRAGTGPGWAPPAPARPGVGSIEKGPTRLVGIQGVTVPIGAQTPYRFTASISATSLVVEPPQLLSHPLFQFFLAHGRDHRAADPVAFDRPAYGCASASRSGVVPCHRGHAHARDNPRAARR